jgi:hypothetical protein
MPYAIRKVRNKSCYKVYNKTTQRVFAKCTTRTRAEKQLRLLRAIDNNPKFVLKNQTRRKGP